MTKNTEITKKHKSRNADNSLRMSKYEVVPSDECRSHGVGTKLKFKGNALSALLSRGHLDRRRVTPSASQPLWPGSSCLALVIPRLPGSPPSGPTPSSLVGSSGQRQQEEVRWPFQGLAQSGRSRCLTGACWGPSVAPRAGEQMGWVQYFLIPNLEGQGPVLLWPCVCSVAQSRLILCNPMDCSPPGSSCLWNLLGKNTGVGCHFLLQGVFSTQGLNLCLLNWQADSLPLALPREALCDVIVNLNHYSAP